MNKVLSVAVSVAAALIISSCSAPQIPQGWALIYGVEIYPAYDDLSYTVDDAEAMAELLENKGWTVTLRTDSSANILQFQTDIETVGQNMNSADRFIFYFSGHGSYISSSDGEPNSAANNYNETIVFYDTMITEDDLAEQLSTLPSTNKTVIIDACYSGGFIGDGFTYSTIDPDYTKEDLSVSFTPSETFSMYMGFTPTDYDLPRSEYSILAASGEDEESYEDVEGSLQHSIFTYFLLQTPETADYNFDGYISLIEAWKYTSLAIDSHWNSSTDINTGEQFMANLSAFPVDPILFEAD